MRKMLHALFLLAIFTAPALSQDIYSNPSVVGTASPGQVPGTATNDNAPSGKVGEYISSSILAGAAVPVTSGTSVDITSLSLTAGDWDVTGNICTNDASSVSMTVIIGWISTTSATLPTAPNGGAYSNYHLPFTLNANQCISVASMRQSLAAPATVYLSTQFVFTGGTTGAYGFIGARRSR